jgi:uncharacterized repeat protein (TIGR03803 family)
MPPGDLYGTTTELFSGNIQNGSVFKLSYPGRNWVFDLLYTFQQITDGASPEATLIIGPDLSLYGTTVAGGGGGCNFGSYGCGTVFKITPPASVPASILGNWTETVLHRFSGSDGAAPSGDLIFDRVGNLYGTTLFGGVSDSGTVFKLSPSGDTWVESLLYSFTDDDPNGGVIFDDAGNLYGTTCYGGDHDEGTVFQLAPSGSGWTKTVLHSFQNGDGYCPPAGVIFDRSGNLYGVTFLSGSGDAGTVFMLSPSGQSWNYAVLHAFSGSDGANPLAGLVMDASGSLYGTTYSGGGTGCDYGVGCGTVFKLTRSGGNWAYTSLYDFMGGSDGAYPFGSLALDANGNLYGTAMGCRGCFGQYGYGVVFEITP